MTQYLLATEIDQIQDLIFRASHLREVVGGSQLLTHFEDPQANTSALRLLLQQHGLSPDDTIVTAGGGSFRLLFSSAEQASAFGNDLAELYRLAVQGSMSVAEPVPFDGDYTQANKLADEKLRQAKLNGSWGQATAHFPYVAFCASCGVALAAKHTKRNPNESRDQFLCSTCLDKSQASKPEMEKECKIPGKFLEEFFKKVEPSGHYTWPGSSDEQDPTSALAQFDSRRYVAYLKADGNNMGKIFGKCNQKEVKDLSQKLSDILRRCLAAPIQMLCQHNPQEEDLIPALPLILGGDDLFALLPAPWALDIARLFCQAYDTSSELKEYAETFKLSQPTMAAAVVICKVNYPYYLAHEVCESLLKSAKRVAKKLALREEPIHSSVVNFEIITGSQHPQNQEPPEGKVYAGLRPYWINDQVPAEWGLPLSVLLEARNSLKELPRRRRAQLRHIFSEAEGKKIDEIDSIKTRLEWLTQRISGREAEQAKRLTNVLKELGDPTTKGFRTVAQIPDPNWYGHGLPDLLDAWDFAHHVTESPDKQGDSL